VIFARYNAGRVRSMRDDWHQWFAWYPCWIYESKGTDIAWVWLEWVDRKRVADGWLRTRPGLFMDENSNREKTCPEIPAA
jgi:hypothetical protein